MADKRDELFEVARTPEQWAAFRQRAEGKSRAPGFLVILCPQETLCDDKRIRAIAEALAMDVYTVRQRLQARVARPLLRFEEERKALQWTEWFRALGIRAFSLSEETILKQGFHTERVIYLDGRTLVIGDVDSTQVRIPTSQVTAIVFGIQREIVENQTFVKSLLTEGERPSTKQQVRDEAVIDLHLHRRHQAIRLKEHSFQFSRLFPRETGASAVLIRKMFRLFGKNCPAAELFDRFGEAETILGTSIQVLGSSAQLRYNSLGMRPSMELEETKQVMTSTARTFDLYSTLAAAECAALPTLRKGVSP